VVDDKPSTLRGGGKFLKHKNPEGQGHTFWHWRNCYPPANNPYFYINQLRIKNCVDWSNNMDRCSKGFNERKGIWHTSIIVVNG